MSYERRELYLGSNWGPMMGSNKWMVKKLTPMRCRLSDKSASCSIQWTRSGLSWVPIQTLQQN